MSALLRVAAVSTVMLLSSSVGVVQAASATEVPAMSSVVTAVSGNDVLSSSGQEAIADLRQCLASKDTLNVYYLVDSSLSLQRADGGGAGSDPTYMRAEILGNSLEQLDAIRDDDTVNWAAGFFSDGYSKSVGWQELNADGPASLRKAIEKKTPSGYTNWPDGLAGAQRELAKQQNAQPGCQMMVWLTDGQLDIQSPDGQQKEDFDALNAMCGAPLSAQGAKPQGGGVFSTFRESGVIVIGALLASDQASQSASADMQALVEGSASGAAAKCGADEASASAVQGAFVEASEPGSLAQVFMQLSAQVAGGYPQPFNADGSFWIDEGVARFRIILTGDWTLTSPTGSPLGQASHDQSQDWAIISESVGVTAIDVDAEGANGQWRLDAADARSLFLFSDLRIVFDAQNTVELTAEGTVEASLAASVMDARGDVVDPARFGTADLSVSYIDSNGDSRPINDAKLGTDARIAIPLPEDLDQAQLRVIASIDPLTTAEHQLMLAPVTTEQTVAIVPAKSFPQVSEQPIKLSTLEGMDGRASGVIRLNGPTEGGDGAVCISSTPTVISDAANRADWQWQLDGVDAAKCVTVPQGGTAEVALSVMSDTQADSFVRAQVPVELRSAGGETLTQSVSVEFQSTHPVNTTAVLIATLVLLALGVLLPLILLWLLNWYTVRIAVPKSTQRAAFPVVIGAGVTRVTAPAGGSALSDAFRFLPPSEKGERSMPDADLGTMRAKVPWFPLRAPWYEVTAPPGTSLIAARAGRGATGRKDRRNRLRFGDLPLDRFWAVVVSDAELQRTKRGEEVRGSVVIYHQACAGERDQLAQRIMETSSDQRLAEAVNRAREELASQQRAKTASSGSAPSVPTSVPAPPSTPGRTVPPIPGRTAGVSAPPASGARTPRPSVPNTSRTAPPPASGSRKPPPRPGAPPPRP